MPLDEKTKENDFASEAKKKLETLVKKLKDPDHCAFLLVIYPEYTPIYEAKRTRDDLTLAGIHVQEVVANNVLESEETMPEFFRRRHGMQQRYLVIAKNLFKLPIFRIRMFDNEIIGLAALKEVSESLFHRECCPEKLAV
jgi:arsenite-transporting ATPase